MFDRLETISVGHRVREKNKNIDEVFIQCKRLRVRLSMKKNTSSFLRSLVFIDLFIWPKTKYNKFEHIK